jgi:lipopolysaccharide transport protein LptA/LPS export ABC transporter protein LptC
VTSQGVRLARGALLGVFLMVAGSVVWTLRHRQTTRRPPAPSPSPTESAPPTASRSENIVYRSFKGDKQSFVLSARKWVGEEEGDIRLQGVSLTFTYVAQGKADTSTVSSEECFYNPAQQKASFRRNVVVQTGQGFELKTDTLTWRGDKGIARTEAKAEFSRKDLSGTSTGLVYTAEEGKIELPADVVLLLQDPDNAPMEIKSGSAVMEREQNIARFGGGVTVTQAGDSLKSGRLEMRFAGEENVVERVDAEEDVVMRTTGQGVPGAKGFPGGTGPREIRGKKLVIGFHPDRTLKEVLAGPDGELTVLSTPPDPPERRRLQARFLTFLFDEQGRLLELQAQKDASFEGTPLPPSKSPARKVQSQSFIGKMDPASGNVREIEFSKDVLFTEGKRRASAQKGWFDGAKSLLILKEDPSLVDEEQGSELKAQAIDLATGTGDVAARHGVRHVLHRKGQGQPGLLVGKDEPAIMTSRFFDYTAATKTAQYREDALLRSGKDEVRAREIRLQEGEAGKRRLEAAGSVVSLLHPRGPDKSGKPAAAVEGRGKEMVYDEAKNTVSYKGDVVIRQGDIQTKSPEATLALTADGSGIEKLVAGSPVEVRQGKRTASGARGTYTPRDEKMVLEGERVVLRDGPREVEGRSLTFRVGDDSILVDGQQMVRTQTVIRKEPPKP